MGFRQHLAALIVGKASSLFASLAGCSPPVVAGLDDSNNALLRQTEAPPLASCRALIGDGVDRLGRLLEGLVDLLQLHHPQVTASSWTDRLLDDLLVLADAHDRFCEVLRSLKQLLAEAQAALRHRDAGRLAAALQARRSSDRGFSSLASTSHAFTQRSASSAAATSGSGDDGALAEAVECATRSVAATSAAIVAGIASSSSSSALGALTSTTAASPAAAMERLRSLEVCVVAAEDGCKLVHRALVNARTSLLNVLSAN